MLLSEVQRLGRLRGNLVLQKNIILGDKRALQNQLQLIKHERAGAL